ncbi:TPA: hypothetical protein N0F65_011145, partial [Lagenidium giganteum]
HHQGTRQNRIRSAMFKTKPSCAKRPEDADAAPTPPMFAMICANNVNRSTEAHDLLHAAGLRVCSFGAGRQVCFPGRSRTTSRVFDFGTPYHEMYQTLLRDDEELFRKNGVLNLLERDMKTKTAPQRWQKLSNKELLAIDVVVCLDYRIFLVVLDDLRMRLRLSFKKKRLHVICLEVNDTEEDARTGGRLALDLCQKINQLPDVSEPAVCDIVKQFEKQIGFEMYYLGIRV